MNKMMSLDEIVSAVNGQLIIGSDYRMDSTVYISGVSKDTRTIKSNELYVALVGENFDGHSFCSMALEKGASVLLVSDASYLPTTALAILVNDTRIALGLLARHYRFKINARVIAVTGSVGKTSTREMICAGLSNQFKVFSTKANLNNDIGLPMTILSAPRDTQVLILEMGMRLRGEISYLTNIACPDIAIITNVGFSHIERLGSQEEILHAKFEIVEGLRAGGVLAINGDDNLLTMYSLNNISIANLIATASVGDTLTKSKCAVSIVAKDVDVNDDGITYSIRVAQDDSKIKLDNITIKAHGIHLVRSSMFAFLCAYLLDGDLELVKQGVASYRALDGRGSIRFYDKYTVIDDAYNAAPESMESAFANLNIVGKGRRRIAVIGGMLELGDYSPMLHERVGLAASRYDIDRFFIMGDDSDSFVKGLLQNRADASYKIYNSIDELETELRGYLREGDVVLFKASNAFGYQALVRRMFEN